MTTQVDIDVLQILTPEERGRRAELEEVAFVGIRAGAMSARAARELRDSRLYRDTHTSYEAYGQEVFGLSRQRLYQLIAFADIADEAAGQGIVITNERMARALGVASSEDWGVVIAAGQGAFQKEELTNSEVKGAAETVRMMAAGHIEHPETGETVPWSSVPQDQQVAAVVKTMQRHSQDRKDFQGTDDVKPMDYVAGLQQMGTAGALRFDKAGYWLEVMDASTGELLEGPKVKSIWDAPRAWRKKHESELQEEPS